MNHLVPAASALLGEPLHDPADLGGSDRSTVLRCRTGTGSVVVKAYADNAEGRQVFTAEASGLAFSDHGPELLAADPAERLLVMADLGAGPSLADTLLTGTAEQAELALHAWADAYGSLAADTAGKQAELAALRERYHAGAALESIEDWLMPFVNRLPELLDLYQVTAPDGLTDDLAALRGAVDPAVYPVFSPGDICPDNNVLTADGMRVLDFEGASFQPVFLDAAYLRMPFATCWCVYRLPQALAAALEQRYRGHVVAAFPELADDTRWHAGVRLAVAAWTAGIATMLGFRAAERERPLHSTRRPVPGGRQLLRFRWEQLIAELEPVGELPALCETARRLLAATEHWQADPLPGYPAFGG